MRKRLHWIVGFGILLTLSLSAERAVVFSGAGFQYLGPVGDSVPVATSNHWSCISSISSASWRIEITRYDQGNQTERTIIGSDGTIVATISTPIIAGHTNLADTAILESGYLPPESLLESHPLWVAFCAPSVVKHYHVAKLPPLDGFGDAETNTVRNIKFRFDSTLNSESTFFSDFTQWNDGTGWTTDNGVLRFHKQTPPFDKGYVAIRMHEMPSSNVTSDRQFIYERKVLNFTTNKDLTLNTLYH